MTASPRHTTNYPGVFYRESKRIGGNGKERVYYIVFKKDGKRIEEKAGRQYANDMTPAKAAPKKQSDKSHGKASDKAE